MPTRKHITDDTFTSATSATPVGADTILFLDATDSLIKKGLVSALPAPTGDTTIYKTTADQTGITSTITNITDLSFTPVANTTYRVAAFISWQNSGASGLTLGIASASSSGISYLRGVMRASGSGGAVTQRVINIATLTENFALNDVTNGNLAQIDLIFRSNGSPVAFNLCCSNNSGGANVITIAAGSVMEVQKTT